MSYENEILGIEELCQFVRLLSCTYFYKFIELMFAPKKDLVSVLLFLIISSQFLNKDYFSNYTIYLI